MDSLEYVNVIFNFVNLFGVFVLTLFFVYIKYNREKSKQESCTLLLNGPKTIPFFGNSLNFILRPVDIALTLIHYSEKYGSRYRLWIGQKFAIVIANAEDAENVMIGSKFLNKGADFHDIFGRVFKNGTFTAEGTEWKKSRKILQLPLKTNVLEYYIQIMNEEATTVIRKFQPMANTGEIFDVGDYIAAATFNIICRTLFDLEEPISQTKHNIFRENSGEYLADSFYLMFRPKLVRKIERIIAGNGKKHQDMFDKMELAYRKAISEQKLKSSRADKAKIEGKNKTFIEYLADEAFSDEDKKAEIITYSIGGSETLSISISFVLLMLAMHHNVQDKVYEELEDIFGNSSDIDVTIDDIKQMNYLDQVLKEVLRIFPLVPFIFRTATEDTVIGDLKIAVGTELIFNVIGVQKDPKYFPNPESFDPERFSEERSKQLPKGSFIPFAIGPRNCIGKAFAMYEMKILCSVILKKYRFDTTMKREDIKMKYSFVMSNVSGYNVSITERNPV